MFGTPGLTTNNSGSVRAQISQSLLRFFFKQSVSRSFQGMFVHNVYPQKVKKEFEQLGSLSESRKKLIFLHDPIYEVALLALKKQLKK
jgi:hypothetical protein